MCISAVLLKCLSYDSIHLMRHIAAIFDNDMHACYDTIIPSCSQALIPPRMAGMDPNTMNTMLRVIRQMKFHVRMVYGISAQYFQSTPGCLILGMLQGSAAVGAIWALLWSVLFRCLECLPQARFLSPRAAVFSIDMVGRVSWMTQLSGRSIPPRPCTRSSNACNTRLSTGNESSGEPAEPSTMTNVTRTLSTGTLLHTQESPG